MSFARKLKRAQDKSIKERQKQVRNDKDFGIVHRRKLVNLGTMTKIYKRYG